MALAASALRSTTPRQAGFLQVLGHNLRYLIRRHQAILPLSIRARLASTMATPWQIRVPASDTGLLKWKQTDESAAKVSELLQKDLESHHVFFNAEGFHNHIVHSLLTLYATGASPSTLEEAYAENHSYQIKAMDTHSGVVEELKKGWTEGCPYLSKGKYYPDFLRFFQDEIEAKGWEKVLLEYVFKGDERSEAIFGRLFAGFLHPLIQLMYGIEWQQPAIIAEGLAQAAVHENRVGGFLTKAEQAATASAHTTSLPELFESVGQFSEKLATSARFDDKNKIYDGIFVRAPDEALEFVKQVKVHEDELDERLAEMVHSCAYVAAAAAFHQPNKPKFDFFLIHHLNSIPFFVTLLSFPWLRDYQKVRILEWKIRLDLIQYIARGCPPLRLDAIKSFVPKQDSSFATKPADLLPRFHEIIDDGHTIKVVRALLIAQELSRKYAGRPWIRIADDETWLKVHQILLQGTEGPQEPALWVRSAGFEEAWVNVPKER
ncbi:uncharacterized protein TrAFT101_008980 [Trichoderma asperellum]|uniref:HypA-like protein n=1 Tax=Trichoderma asperellum (strain ATCC 204424 / CBS 433.97 / NBRC 101777) TaxID=1042311 RepID=A0A2T3YS77_TRIA4|nr:hypothetical protein M441DRAFT_62736 [Trichoderma asperellum CBS 433.97]PTB35431.1 hypothetical protein M441DRAFT_62736 [Trichoderma asperellum CBS 433.97]UKZ94091.1 hypothetical protein TrAFT101_008980 [Trichoderma asperellum]